MYQSPGEGWFRSEGGESQLFGRFSFISWTFEERERERGIWEIYKVKAVECQLTATTANETKKELKDH